MKLSATQAALIERMRAAGGKVTRMPGGFWVTPGTPVDARGVPAVWVGANTVLSLAAKGVLRETQRQQNSGYSTFVVEYELTGGQRG